MIVLYKMFLIQKLQGKGIKYFFGDTIGKQHSGVKTDGEKEKNENFRTSRKKQEDWMFFYERN